MPDTDALYRGALQDIWPNGTCYGCGPANPVGLQIKSYWNENGTAVVATFHPEPHQNSGYPNVMYGGLVASLIDCHSVWAATAWTYREEGRPHGSPPIISYVTGRLEVNYLKPTPLDQPILLSSVLDKIEGKKAIIKTTLGTADTITAQGEVITIRFYGDKSAGA